MRPPALRLAAAALAALLRPALAAAQEPATDASLDVTLGAGAGRGGEYRQRAGVAADLLFGFPVRPARTGSVRGGLSVGFQGSLASNDMCTFGSRGQCLEEFPSFTTVALVGGWEARTGSAAAPGATLRLLAGPAFVHLDGDDSAGQRGNAAGLQGRLDAATPPLGPLALVASLRGTLVPRTGGETLGTWALGMGLRVR